MTTYQVFPDAEAVLIQALNASEFPACAALSAQPDLPCVLVKRIGGVPAERHHLDLANIQIEVWGNDKAEASSLAQEVRAAIHGLEGIALTEQQTPAFISGVEDQLGIAWLPDPVTDRARYVFGVGVYLTTVPD